MAFKYESIGEEAAFSGSYSGPFFPEFVPPEVAKPLLQALSMFGGEKLHHNSSVKFPKNTASSPIDSYLKAMPFPGFG